MARKGDSGEPKVIYMPLYVGDFLLDTAHLNAEQSGAYLHLMMHQFISGDLPNCDKQLSRLAKMSLSKWKRNKETLSEFFTISDKSWTQKRAKFERERALSKIKKASESGKQGGRGNKKGKANALTSLKQSPQLHENQSESESDPTSKISKGRKGDLPVAPPSRLDEISRDQLKLEFSEEVISHYEALVIAQAEDAGKSINKLYSRVKVFILRDKSEKRGMFKEARAAPGSEHPMDREVSKLYINDDFSDLELPSD